MVEKAAIFKQRIFIYLRPVKWVNCTSSGHFRAIKMMIKMTSLGASSHFKKYEFKTQMHHVY